MYVCSRSEYKMGDLISKIIVRQDFIVNKSEFMNFAIVAFLAATNLSHSLISWIKVTRRMYSSMKHTSGKSGLILDFTLILQLRQ